MGYETCFRLEILEVGLEREPDDVAEVFAALVDTNEDASFAIGYSGESLGPTTWNNHEDELREFSKKYPHYLFTLYGEGESSDDFWVDYYFNGTLQSQEGVVEYPPWDKWKAMDEVEDREATHA